MPSSSLVEGWVGVVVEVGVWVKMQFSCLTFLSGWLGGWLEKSDIKVISTQVVVEVEVGVELGKNLLHHYVLLIRKCLCKKFICIVLCLCKL